MDPEKSAMEKHQSKIEVAPQLELFDSSEYGPAENRSWLIVDSEGKPDHRAMEILHDKAREDEQYGDQRELARYLSGTPHKKLSYLLSDFEARIFGLRDFFSDCFFAGVFLIHLDNVVKLFVIVFVHCKFFSHGSDPLKVLLQSFLFS